VVNQRRLSARKGEERLPARAPGLPLGLPLLELRALLGRENVDDCIMLLLECRFELRAERPDLLLHVAGTRVVGLLQRVKLLAPGTDISKELGVLLNVGLVELLDLSLLRIGQIQFLRDGAAKSRAASKTPRLPRGLELCALVGSEEVAHGLAVRFARRLELRPHGLELSLHAGRAGIIGLFQSPKLAHLRPEIGVKLLVLRAIGDADILQLLLLSIGEIQSSRQTRALPMWVERRRRGRLGEGNRLRCRNHECNDNLFHAV
jgi:hypothetical protein